MMFVILPALGYASSIWNSLLWKRVAGIAQGILNEGMGFAQRA